MGPSCKFLLVLITCVCCEPGIRVRVTENGLQYADRIGAILLNDALKDAKIPDFDFDISGGPGSGSASVTNAKTSFFSAPSFAYILQPPDALKWQTTGGRITIRGNWSAWYKILFKMWFKGYFSASISGINLSASVKVVKDVDEKPAVQLLSCSARVSSVSVTISGGFMPAIINLFSSYIGDAVKSAVQSQVCSQARTVLVKTLNQKLKSLPTKIDLGENFMLDYTLYANPTVGQDYVETLLNGSITWIDGSSAPIDSPPLPPARPPLDRMVYIWGSDYVLNTFFHSAHKHNVSHIDVERKAFPEVAPYLRTTCPGDICIGNISQTIRTRFPNAYCVLALSTASAPQAVVQPQDARLTATATADLYVEPKRPQNLLISFDVNFSGDLTVSVNDSRRLTGDLKIDNCQVKVNRSNIGPISQLEIDLVLFFIKPIVQQVANSYLNTGLVIPTIPDVQLKNAQVVMLDRAVQIDSDMKYKNYTFLDGF